MKVLTALVGNLILVSHNNEGNTGGLTGTQVAFIKAHLKTLFYFRIAEGRVSKLMLKRNGEIVYNYDRGLDIEPADEDTEYALAILLKEYN